MMQLDEQLLGRAADQTIRPSGINLERFASDVRAYRVLVSYNGKTFDAPFVERDLGVRLDQAHIDLRHVLKSSGYSGGLKGCEAQLGLSRGEAEGIDGFLAVLLWDEYARSGNARALETLLAYNVADVLTLERLMAIAYNAKLKATPFFEELILPDPRLPNGGSSWVLTTSAVDSRGEGLVRSHTIVLCLRGLPYERILQRIR